MNRQTICIRLLLSSCMFSGAAFANDAARSKPEQLVATVGSQAIYESDLTSAARSQLLPLERQQYDIKRRALDNLIDRKVLDVAARKEGLTVDKLLQDEVDAKLPEPSEAELEAFYLGQGDRVNRPFNEIKDQLRAVFTQVRIQRARQEYVKALRSANDISVLLTPPIADVSYDPARLRGDSKAPVIIIEFSDFQCPYCRQMRTTLNNVLTKYKGQVAVAYRDFPLVSIHGQAQLAAEASRCAAEQGKFWEYHDQLFSSSNLGRDALLSFAHTLMPDEMQFNACLTAGKYRAEVQKDAQDGIKAGLSGTPALFINGVFLAGSQPEDALAREIDDALARSR